MFAITSFGLVPVSDFHVEAGQQLFIGDSNCPSFVVVSSVADEIVSYYDGHFKTQHVMTKAIFKDLAASGVKTWLNGPSAWRNPELSGLLKKAQNGESLLPCEKVNFKDFQSVDVIVKPALEGRSSGDAWRDAEMFGSVGGLDENLLLISMSRQELRDAKVSGSDFSGLFTIVEEK